MKASALKFVRMDKIEAHLKQGWLGAVPNAPHHHLRYGIEMKWICDCKIPGLKDYAKEYRRRRVPEASQETRAGK